MRGCQIGANCNLGQNVNVAPGVRIGENVKIQNNVSLYTGVELENDVFCGPSMVFTNVMTPRSHVNRKSEYQRTLVKRGASLGANSTVVCGVTIGEYAFVGAGAVVTKDIPPYALVVGVPARQIGWVCACGIRLDEYDSQAECPACGKRYLIQDGARVVPHVDSFPSETLEVQEILDLREDAPPGFPEISPAIQPRAQAASAGNN